MLQRRVIRDIAIKGADAQFIMLFMVAIGMGYLLEGLQTLNGILKPIPVADYDGDPGVHFTFCIHRDVSFAIARRYQ